MTLTAGELIKELNKLPKTMPVAISVDAEGNGYKMVCDNSSGEDFPPITIETARTTFAYDLEMYGEDSEEDPENDIRKVAVIWPV